MNICSKGILGQQAGNQISGRRFPVSNICSKLGVKNINRKKGKKVVDIWKCFAYNITCVTVDAEIDRRGVAQLG